MSRVTADHMKGQAQEWISVMKGNQFSLYCSEPAGSTVSAPCHFHSAFRDKNEKKTGYGQPHVYCDAKNRSYTEAETDEGAGSPADTPWHIVSTFRMKNTKMDYSTSGRLHVDYRDNKRS